MPPAGGVSGLVKSLRKEWPDRHIRIANFTPQVLHDYRLRVPFAGKWREALNTDSSLYGGSNVGNAGGVSTVAMPESQELHVVIPPLAAVFFVPEL